MHKERPKLKVIWEEEQDSEAPQRLAAAFEMLLEKSADEEPSLHEALDSPSTELNYD